MDPLVSISTIARRCSFRRISSKSTASASRRSFDYLARHVDYLPGRTLDGAEAPRSSYELGSQPAELKTKVSLLKHFEKYMMDRLYGEYDYVFQDLERTSGMDYVVTYLRMKQVIVFKLSHEAIQVSAHT
jgi:hypothetical protein